MSEFNRLLLNLHAEARRCDRDQAMLGALGVGAFAYPHQLDSVHRMLTAPACRWLLGDEVGLGKTVQAIMVMRALAAQSPRPFIAALVVPDDLVEQWEKELLARGHAIAIEAGEAGEASSNLVIRLARPSRIAAGGKINPDKVDLLLIDEFTKLQVAVRNELITAGRSIPHIIAMTATPALHQSRTRSELLELLEPEAARIARAEDRSILKVLAEREETALKRYDGELADAARRRAVEDSYGLYRRLIRTQRTDYPDTLPQRRYQPIRVAPTDGDIERAKATRAYLEAAETAGLDYKRDALLQVAGRSPQSLRERLSTLKRTQGVQHAWRRIDTVLRDEPGDAKLDALVDHLRGVLARRPHARIMIVAEDNPTTDYLHDTLSKLVDAKIARKRRVMRAAEELEVQVAMLKDALEEFVGGEANILVAALDAREGHNLQFADEIIFFALPWSPHDIQQWIGRIDRLGTRGVPSSRTIAITPIVTENSIEARILDVLEATKVFEKSDVYDESEWAEISNAINAAAEGNRGASWTEAASCALDLGDAADEWLKSTKLPPSPRTTIAEKYASRLRARDYACPLIVGNHDDKLTWFQWRERGLDVLLKLAREEFFDIRGDKDGDQSFKTIWYKSKHPELPLGDIDSRHAGHRQAFITRRTAIECPPNTYVEQGEGSKRRLHFLDHGCSLHDQIVTAVLSRPIATDLTSEFTVEYPAEHPILAHEGQRLLVAIATLDLSGALAPDVDAVVGAADPTASKAEQDARASTVRMLGAALAADRRWLLDRCPPEFMISVYAEEGGGFTAAPDAAALILDSAHARQRGRQLGRRRSALAEAALVQARKGAQQDLQKRGSEALNRALLAVSGGADYRLFAIDADIEAQIAAARAELASAEKLDQKLVFNQAAVRGAALAAQLAEAAGNARKAWLAGAAASVERQAALSKPRYFWVVARKISEERQASQQ
ncbi:MAG: helicase-related protein [Sphingobium sp.]